MRPHRKLQNLSPDDFERGLWVEAEYKYFIIR